MKKIKKLSYLLYTLIYILLIIFILTILNLIFPINSQTNSILCLISMSLYSSILGINKGKKTTNKGYITGTKTGLIIILLLLIMNSFFISFSITIKEILYYLIIFTCTVFGSIIGINKKNA